MTTTTIKQSKVTRADRIQKVVAGLKQFFGALQTITFGARTYALPDLFALLTAAITADLVTKADRDKLTADAEAARLAYENVDPLLRYIEMYVRSQLADDPQAADKLGVFGYSPRKLPKRTAAQKASAVVKEQSTRAARDAGVQPTAKQETATPPPAAPVSPKPTA